MVILSRRRHRPSSAARARITRQGKSLSDRTGAASRPSVGAAVRSGSRLPALRFQASRSSNPHARGSQGKPSVAKSITSLSSVTRVGLVLAKNIFQVHPVDARRLALRTQRPRFRPLLHLHRPQHPSRLTGGRSHRCHAPRQDRRRRYRSETNLGRRGRGRDHGRSCGVGALIRGASSDRHGRGKARATRAPPAGAEDDEAEEAA